MPFHPENAVLWAEIPVTNLAAAQAFYETLLGIEMQPNTSGPKPVVDFKADKSSPGVAGHIYLGTPAARGTGATIHLAIPGTVEAAIQRCIAAGGVVKTPVITIRPGRFANIEDLDGNSIGLFEPV